MGRRAVFAGASLLAVLVSGEVLARSSLGIGTAEASTQISAGPFQGLFTQIAVWQREFFSALRHALVDLKRGDGALLFLTGLSFLYGVFHAAGPGHGKAVISAYMLASRAELKRGVALSFVSSLVQATTAIVVVCGGWYLLRGTGIAMSDASDGAELLSYLMVAAVGLFLLVRAIARLGRHPMTRAAGRRLRGLASAILPKTRTASSALAFASPGESDWRDSSERQAVRSGAFRSGNGPSTGFAMPAADGFAREDVCADDGEDCDCGRQHIVSPDAVTQPLSLRSSVVAVFAVGLRPCTGAIVVLTFALLNGLYLGGVLSVLAMALGTAITVSALASATVLGRGALERAGRRTPFASLFARVLEIAGALCLTLLGIVLTGGALFG